MDGSTDPGLQTKKGKQSVTYSIWSKILEISRVVNLYQIRYKINFHFQTWHFFIHVLLASNKSLLKKPKLVTSDKLVIPYIQRVYRLDPFFMCKLNYSYHN